MQCSIRPWRALLVLVVIAVSLSMWTLNSRLPDSYTTDSANRIKKPGAQDGDQNVGKESDAGGKLQNPAPAGPPTKQEEITNHMCKDYPDDGSVVVAIKTGATEAAEKLKPLLETALSCVKDLLIFSDLEEELHGMKVYDVLSLFDESYKQRNADFDIYWKQQELKKKGEEYKIPGLAQMPAPEREDYGKGKKAPWALDKYKFIPEVEMAYELRPGKNFYVFLEADTYVSWPSLVAWLDTLDFTSNLYIGLAIQKSDDREPKWFAQGGGGFVLSGAAAKEFAVEHRGMTSKLAPRMRDWWAGDFMLADALYDEMGLKVSNAEPMFNMFGSESIPFGLDTRWCEAAITLHHMDEAKVRQLFKKEEEANFERLLLRDVYNVSYPNGVPEKRENWDNIASDKYYILEAPADVSDPNKDFDACKAACERHNECLQFNFLNTTNAKPDPKIASVIAHEQLNSCYLSKAFRLGHAKQEQPLENEDEPGTYRSWTSGWRKEKIAEWVSSRKECPSGDRYNFVDLKHDLVPRGSGQTV